ncbi:MAG TPA: hypothetical protein VHZ97_11635 [Pseudonocardiaceae bacterium]|jgi:hypothetical protein|nr:hypothetical protein [Pseudonocardiaceae bacterium]
MRFIRNNKDDGLPAGIRFLKTEQTATATYRVYSGPGQRAALDFLRQTPVREELVYNIVETPEGNLGCDFIYIFRESDGTPIELVTRRPNQQPTPSESRCAWCGYFIKPYMIPVDDQTIGSLQMYFTHDDLRQLVHVGGGLRCRSCSLLQCAVCNGLASSDWEPDKLHCRACGSDLSVHTALGVDARATAPVLGTRSEDGRSVSFPADPMGDELWGLAPLRVPWSIDVSSFLARDDLPYLWPQDESYRNYIDGGKHAQGLLRASWINVFLHHRNPDVVLRCLREAPPETMLNLGSFADLLASPAVDPPVKEEAVRVFWGLDDGSASYTLNVLLSRGLLKSNYDTNSVHQVMSQLRASCPPERRRWLDDQLTNPDDD